ncbi:MAG: mannose-6-phosphate isomerase, class I [Spirochaetia bacterium]|jgi:mannose-6-phosphate isomerase|nr:mannose-6-phosphate isomerase, class I [Spirochaetia bacterium]
MKETGIVLFELKNQIRGYAWGSLDGLKLYCGIDSSPGKPAAECWMGAHPEAPSALVRSEGGVLSLRRLIDLQPRRTLGDPAMLKSSELPFLFKALSAAAPLSIQVHPDKKKAALGFEREESLGIPRASSLRTYRDPNHKPELALALSPFRALCGLRDMDETALFLGPALSSMLGIQKTIRAEAYSVFLSRLLGLDAEEKKVLFREAGARALELSKSGEPRTQEAGQTALRLAALYPGDPGALAPLFMRLLLLQPGQALYIPPGLLHSYVEGTILEVMASSDNVVRGGLSPKHIDKEELLRVVDPEARALLLDKVTQSPAPGISLHDAGPTIETWPCPAEEFVLERIRPESRTRLVLFGGGPEILLCTEGAVRVTASEDDPTKVQNTMQKKELCLARGGSAFIGASCTRYEIDGSGTVYRVRYPGHDGSAGSRMPNLPGSPRL